MQCSWQTINDRKCCESQIRERSRLREHCFSLILSLFSSRDFTKKEFKWNQPKADGDHDRTDGETNPLGAEQSEWRIDQRTERQAYGTEWRLRSRKTKTLHIAKYDYKSGISRPTVILTNGIFHRHSIFLGMDCRALLLYVVCAYRLEDMTCMSDIPYKLWGAGRHWMEVWRPAPAPAPAPAGLAFIFHSDMLLLHKENGSEMCLPKSEWLGAWRRE